MLLGAFFDGGGVVSILVTGGAGFIGSNFVLEWLAESDEQVINLDKRNLRRQYREPARSQWRPPPCFRARRHR